MSEPFIGQIQMFGFNFNPRGWAQCDGQLLPISQNSALFSLLGTIYGGDGSSTFGLPDLRGRVPIHYGQGAGLSNYQLGQRGGVEAVALIVSQIPAHNHVVTPRGNSAAGDDTNPTGKFHGESDNIDLYANEGNSNMGAAVCGQTGGNLPHTNIQPYLTVNFCIALQGLFPSRS